MATFFLPFLLCLIAGLTNKTDELEELGSGNPQSRTKRACLRCGSTRTIRNGSTASGKKKHLCENCGRQFAENPSNVTVSSSTKQLVEKLLLERISLRGITRVTDVS